METAGIGGTSRKGERREQLKRGRRLSHFQTARFGGLDENQIIRYLWGLVKPVETLRDAGSGQESQETIKPGTRPRRQIRVEIWCYFMRQRRRNVKIVAVVLVSILCMAGVFGILIGVDRATGNSAYPYLNHGGWIVYGWNSGKMQRNDVIVFEKNGECMVRRIAGLSGDTVEINPPGNRVMISGTQVREDYVTLADMSGDVEGKTDAGRLGAPQTVMDGQYLVLGDNRGVSVDSRDSSIGTVSVSAVMGRVILVVRAVGWQRG